jgi:hypothetical protein
MRIRPAALLALAGASLIPTHVGYTFAQPDPGLRRVAVAVAEVAGRDSSQCIGCGGVEIRAATHGRAEARPVSPAAAAAATPAHTRMAAPPAAVPATTSPLATPAATDSTRAAPASAAVTAQDPFEEGLVEVVAERLTPITVIVLVNPAGGMLLPVGQLATHLGFSVDASAPVITLPRPGGTTAVLDTREGILIADGDTLALTPAELTVRGGEVYLRSERLAVALDATITVNPATLTVAITRPVPFPAQQRIVAEQRRAMLLARQGHADRDVGDGVPFGTTSGIGVLDWDVSTRGFDPGALTSARLRSGAALLGGELVGAVTLEAGRDAASFARDAVIRYRRVFAGQPYVSQVNAGGIMTSGIFARFVRGVEIGNRPFMNQELIGQVLVEPDLPAGWEYEIFQGNRLLGFSEPGLRDPVAIPLRTGTTPVQVRMLGPSGEEVVTTLLYQTPVSMLGKGRFEYMAGAGRCQGSLCESLVHADARYGATERLTLGGGVEVIKDSTTSHARPYAVASFTTGQMLTGELQLMPGALLGSTLALHPRDGRTLHLRSNLSRPGFGPISLVPDELARWDMEVAWDERRPARSGVMQPIAGGFSSVRTGLAASGSADGIERWRATAAGSYSRGYAELRYDYENAAVRRHLVSGRTSTLLPMNLLGTRYRPMVNATLGVGDVGVRLAELGATAQIRDGTTANLAVTWNRDAGQPAMSLSWISRIGPVQSAVRAIAGREGASSTLMLSGSTAVTHAGELTTQPVARTGYAGLSGTVYVDLDGDGEFSEGDQPVPAMAIVAGGHRAVTDENGRYRVWGLQPYAVTEVAVDSTRVPDPSWTAADGAVRVRPIPNTARRVDIALVQTREVVGSVVALPGVATAGGVTVLITDVDNPDSRITGTTFSDGQFYISRVRPGRYTLTIAPSSLAALGATADPDGIPFSVSAAHSDFVIELPPVRLSPIR